MKPSTAAVLLLAALLAAAGAASADDTVNAQHMKPWPPGGCSASGCGSSSSMFVSRLRGDNAGAATAQMTLVVDAAAQTATYSLMMYNVNGYTMSHIHVGAAGINGPPVVLLLPGLKAGQNTTIAAADLPTIAPIDICSMTYTSKFAAADLVQLNGVAFSWTDFMTNLAAGTLYANIHTAAAPAGLIRGQLLPSKAWKGNVEASCADRKGWKHGK